MYPDIEFAGAKALHSVMMAVKLYNKWLAQRPILAKSTTSGVLGMAGALVSNKLKGLPNSLSSILPYGTFGFILVGPIMHHFYKNIEAIFGPNIPAKIFVERCIYSPLFLLLSLYTLERLQGTSHEITSGRIKQRYLSALVANWKIWTVPQLVNLSLVPIEYRALFANVVAFFWNIYLANKTSSAAAVPYAHKD